MNVTLITGDYQLMQVKIKSELCIAFLDKTDIKKEMQTSAQSAAKS